MRISALAAVAASAVGCHNQPSKLDAVTGPGPPCDALWDLAPTGTEVGIVASPRGLGLVFDALTAVKQLSVLPDFASIAPQLDMVTAGLFGAPGATPADAGMSAAPGFALFVTPSGVLAIMPVTDRAKFSAAKRGALGSADTDDISGTPCKQIAGHYACASNAGLLAALGSASLRGKPALAGGRGDVELYAPSLALFGDAPAELAVVAELHQGELAVRGRWTGTPSGGLGKLIGVVAPHVDASHASGFASANAANWLADLPAVPLAGDVTLQEFGRAFVGPVSIVTPAGSFDLQVRAPLVDLRPAATAIEHCPELGKLIDLAADQPQDACRFRLEGAAALELEAWVDTAAKELRMGANRHAPAEGEADQLTPIGRELASEDWTAVLWGRGSMLRPKQLATTAPQASPEAGLAGHALALLAEVGAGLRVEPNGVGFRGVLRTIWANPPDVVARLLAISSADISRGTAVAPAAVIAGTAPDSPFARDFAAGQGGLILPSGVFAITTMAFIVPGLEAALAGATDAKPADAAE